MPYFTFIYALFVFRAIVRAIFGPEYYIHFIGANGTKYTKFAHNLPDALEWLSCGLNDERVKIVSRAGYFVAQRG